MKCIFWSSFFMWVFCSAWIFCTFILIVPLKHIFICSYTTHSMYYVQLKLIHFNWYSMGLKSCCEWVFFWKQWITNRPSGYKCAITTKPLIKEKTSPPPNQQFQFKHFYYYWWKKNSTNTWLRNHLITLNSFLSFYSK